MSDGSRPSEGDVGPSSHSAAGDSELEELRAKVAALEAERRHLSAVLDVLPVGVWIADVDGRLLRRNEAAATIWDRETRLSRTPDEYGEDYRGWHLDGTRVRSEEWGMTRALREGETVVAEEVSIETATGNRKRILNYAAPIRTGDGTIEGAVAVNVDVTALRAAEAQRAQILAAVSQAVVVTDVQGQVTYWNPAAERLYGWTSEEAVGRRILELTVPARVRDRAAELLSGVNEGAEWTGEFDVRRKDGSTFPARVDLSPIPGPGGGAVGFVGLSTDLSTEKEAEERREELIRALDRERSRLEDIFRSAPAFMAVLRGPEHVFELANPLYRATVGGRELIGRPVREALPEVVGQGFVDILDEVWESGEPHVGREEPVLLENQGAGGRDRVYLNYVYQPIRDADGEVSRIVVQGVDVTDLVLARQRAEAANRVKSEFLHTMSHELRTPLNAILGYADLIDAGVPVQAPAEVLAQVHRIRLGARHLRGIIDDVLQVGRLEAERERVHRERVDIDELLEEVRAIAGPLAREKGIELRIERAELPGPVISDGRKLRQILVNLVGNAAKFTDSGSVELSVAPHGEDRLAIRVADTGIGMTAAELERLFDPFWQADREKRRTQGTGLGLTIARRAAEALGGGISVESQVGEGSEFIVDVPRVAAPEEASSS